MNIHRFIGIVLVFLFCGCSPEQETVKKNSISDPLSKSESSSSTEIREVVLEVDDTMQFRLKRFEVKPCQNVRLILRHVGRMPKTAMGHNWVLLAFETSKTTFAAEALRHATNGYVPPESTAVLARTDLIGGGEESVITFTAPLQPGEYDYVCSFPGHTQSGMTGVMIVR